MASKKKENELQYLQNPLPSAQKRYKTTRLTWNGINYAQKINTGTLSAAKNITTTEAPYISVTPKEQVFVSMKQIPCFERHYQYSNKIYWWEYLASICNGNSRLLELNVYPRFIVISYLADEVFEGSSEQYLYFALITNDGWHMSYRISEDTSRARTLLCRHSTYTLTTSGNINTAVSPDTNLLYWDHSNAKESGILYEFNYNVRFSYSSSYENPRATYSDHLNFNDIVSYRGRIIGCTDNMVAISKYNEYKYKSYFVPGAEYSENDAWHCTPVTDSDGDFTAIFIYDETPIVFKEKSMSRISGTYNPFRLVNIADVGAQNKKCIAEANSTLFFCDDRYVYSYNGARPKIISFELNLKQINNPIAGSDGRCYYLYLEDESNNKHLFVYDTYTLQWSERGVPHKYTYKNVVNKEQLKSDNVNTDNSMNEYTVDGIKYRIPAKPFVSSTAIMTESSEEAAILDFAFTKQGFLAMTEDGIFKLDTDVYNATTYTVGDEGDTTTYNPLEWMFETDIITNNTMDIKHLKKIQIYAEFNQGSTMKISAIYDENTEEPVSLYEFIAEKNGKVPIRLLVRQSANYSLKLHFEGTGYMKIYSMELVTEGGGELYA